MAHTHGAATRVQATGATAGKLVVGCCARSRGMPNHAAKHAAGDDMQDTAHGLKPQLEVLGKLEEQEQRLRQQYNKALQEVLWCTPRV